MCRKRLEILVSCLFLSSFCCGTAKAQTSVDSWDALKTGVAAGEVALGGDIQATANQPIRDYQNGAVIHGNGHKITGSDYMTDSAGGGGLIVLDKVSGDGLSLDGVDVSGFHNTSSDDDASGTGVIYVKDSNMGTIDGKFSDNSVISSYGTIGSVVSNAGGKIAGITDSVFEGNSVAENSSEKDEVTSRGGAVYNGASDDNAGVIGDITGSTFKNNSVTSENNGAGGGAIYNSADSSIGNIAADFSGNKVISNANVDKDRFVANGGAIYNNASSIGNISGNFTQNSVEATQSGSAGGGAILNRDGAEIKDVSGTFSGNTATGSGAYGGAILSAGSSTEDSKIGNITADFTQNEAVGTEGAYGGAIDNEAKSTIGTISGKFDGNAAVSEKESLGGAIYNGGTITNIENATFTDNKVEATTEGGQALGGAIYTETDLTISANNGDSLFSGNVTYVNGESFSNAVYVGNQDAILSLNAKNGNITFDDGIYGSKGYQVQIGGDATGSVNLNEQIGNAGEISVDDGVTVNFGEKVTVDTDLNVNNGTVNDASIVNGGKISVAAGSTAHNLALLAGSGFDFSDGAVLTGSILIDKGAVSASSYDHIFANDVESKLILTGGFNEAFTALKNDYANKSLVLANGTYNFSGESGKGLELSGWESITIGSDDGNAAVGKLEGNMNMPDVTDSLYIKKNGTFDLSGSGAGVFEFGGSVVNDGTISFQDNSADDVTTIKGSYTAQNNAQMIVDVDPSAGTSDLLKIEGDVVGHTSVVVNALGSGISRNQILFADVNGDDEATASSFDVYRVMNNPFMWNAVLEDKKWYFDKTNIVVGEVIAYTGLPGAGIDQTRGLIDNISANSHGTEKTKKECQYYKDYFRCRSYNTLNTWVAPVYGTSDVTAPFKYTADVAGVDAGVDVDYGFYNKLGLFVSYRTGAYDFDGTGEEISSDTGSSIDINSYLAGLYYRYERGYLWTMSTIFGGVQNAEMSSDDGVSSDTSGMELGASFEAGLIFNPMTDLFIEPIVGLFYTHIAYDDFTDDYGKKVEYDAVMNLDLEAGIRIEKRFKTDNGYAKFYFKPSVIQSLSSGDVNISELPAMSSTDNRTLTKFEFGGSIDFSDGWNGFGNVSYITGSDYSNVAANVGVNYTW